LNTRAKPRAARPGGRRPLVSDGVPPPNSAQRLEPTADADEPLRRPTRGVKRLQARLAA